MPTKADLASAQIQRKAGVVDEIATKLRDADAAVLTEYRGLSVSDLAELRAALRPAGTEYKIFKNTLARRAAGEVGLDELVPTLEGPVAIAFVRGDAVNAAKALRDFGRSHPSLVVKGGLLGTRVLTTGDVAALAEVPPREVLLAKLAGGFQAPLVKAAGLFQAFTRNFAYGLSAYIDQRVAGGEAAPEPEAAEPESEPEADVVAPPEAAADAEAEPEAAAEPAAEAAPADEAPESTESTDTETAGE
ncbi:MAG TPA: 50S ribosomal protein L10 [Acidimicrobiia bacterium]|nr:50S ribosomal protein L10 [Acidimicrobiia bacterium]